MQELQLVVTLIFIKVVFNNQIKITFVINKIQYLFVLIKLNRLGNTLYKMETQETSYDETINEKLISNLHNLKIYAFKLTGDASRADDLLQETSMRVMCNADSFVYNSNFKGWASTIMHNVFINERARAARCVTTSDDIFFDGEYFDYNVDTDGIMGAINTLSVEHRKVFLMFADGYKYAEISEELDIPPGTVKSRIHKARIILRELLKDYME